MGHLLSDSGKLYVSVRPCVWRSPEGSGTVAPGEIEARAVRTCPRVIVGAKIYICGVSDPTQSRVRAQVVPVVYALIHRVSIETN